MNKLRCSLTPIGSRNANGACIHKSNTCVLKYYEFYQDLQMIMKLRMVPKSCCMVFMHYARGANGCKNAAFL